jgi:hypothetical protein
VSVRESRVTIVRAERRRRARAATRGHRWVGPARGGSARANGETGSTRAAGLVIVRDLQALTGMEADLRSRERAQPVVGLACAEEIAAPALAAQRVREIVGVGPRIYYVPGAYLLHRLRGMLGGNLALPAGGARVWWPGISTRCDPAAHPLVLALDSEGQADMLAEFARQFDLSRPLVRGEIALIEGARRLAEEELAQAREQNNVLRRAVHHH